MKKEQLIALGLTPEQADGVLKVHKETLDGSYIPKHRFDEVAGELKTTKEALNDRDTQIGNLKKFEGDTNALKEQLKSLQEANVQKDKEHQAALATERRRNAVKLTLINDEDGKPHDPDMLLGLLDIESIKLDDSGKVTSGLKEQLDGLRKDKAFLFAAKTQTPPAGGPQQPPFIPKGATPLDGMQTPPAGDPAVNYGLSLAQAKLGMMGVQPATNDAQTKK